jgi:hypothetical protein
MKLCLYLVEIRGHAIHQAFPLTIPISFELRQLPTHACTLWLYTGARTVSALKCAFEING